MTKNEFLKANDSENTDILWKINVIHFPTSVANT